MKWMFLACGSMNLFMAFNSLTWWIAVIHFFVGVWCLWIFFGKVVQGWGAVTPEDIRREREFREEQARQFPGPWTK